MPPLEESEPRIVGTCAHCNADLYAYCDATHDRYDDEWYCDDNCYVEAKRKAGDLVTEVKER